MVELLISVAILAIIAVTTLTMMSSSAQQYEYQYESMQLQYQAQIVMTQLEEMSIDATGGLIWDDVNDSYHVVSRVTEYRLVSGVEQEYEAKSVHHVSLNTSSGETYYGKGSIEEADSWATLTNPTPDNLLSRNLTSLAVTFTEDAATGEATAVRFDAVFERDNRDYEITHEVALRNRPLVADDLSTLLAELDAQDAAKELTPP